MSSIRLQNNPTQKRTPQMMITREGHILIETQIGEHDGVWAWRARGAKLAEFCGTEAWKKYADCDGWIHGAPFSCKRDAERACEKFEREFLRQMYPDFEVEDAPTLN
jgi:hypothetical protein